MKDYFLPWFEEIRLIDLGFMRKHRLFNKSYWSLYPIIQAGLTWHGFRIMIMSK